jgi:hypothetical protein
VAKHTEQTTDYDYILAMLTAKREQIEEAILAIERLKTSELGGRGKVPGWNAPSNAVTEPTASQPAPAPAKKKRQISAAGRKRIIEATKKRWANQRAAKEAAGMAATKTVAKAPRKVRTAQKSV